MKPVVSSLAFLIMAASFLPARAEPVGPRGPVGCLENPRTVDKLRITKPGVYENLLVDGNGAGGNLVKITAAGVTLRHCEIRNGGGNGVGVFASGVVIEKCRIHHLLAGSFKDQRDAHGITGRWGDVTIRDCDIGLVSGDAIQFDPDRQSAGAVTIERCRLWTGPLPADAAGFKAGERPGENAVDTKTRPEGERCRLVIRNCHLHGWRQPAPIANASALNLKERVDAEISGCVLHDNEIAFRLRGPTKRGGAHVRIADCAVYDGEVGVRTEDRIENLKIDGLAFGAGVKRKYHFVGGKPGAGYANTNERKAGPLEGVLKRSGGGRN